MVINIVNILVILMYNKNNKTNKVKKNLFKKIFKNTNTKCYFRHWESKNIINTIKKYNIKGIILSGSEYRILEEHKKISKIPNKIFNLNIPILGECYGFQYLIKYFGNKTYINSFKNNKIQSYYKLLKIIKPFKLNTQKYHFNHHDYIVKLPLNWASCIKNKKIIYMAYDKTNKNIGIQFHPEVNYKIGKNFYKKWIKYISS
jgi:GMP synthase-like glutamine amidotransferase